MTNRSFITILKNHHVDYVIQDDQVVALGDVVVYTANGQYIQGEWYIVTDYQELMHWLGY